MPQGGVIGLEDIHGTTPKAIAVAVHEAYHAWLHQQGRNHNDEEMVNKLATKWLRKNLSGMFLHSALNILLHSKIHYGHN